MQRGFRVAAAAAALVAFQMSTLAGAVPCDRASMSGSDMAASMMDGAHSMDMGGGAPSPESRESPESPCGSHGSGCSLPTMPAQCSLMMGCASAAAISFAPWLAAPPVRAASPIAAVVYAPLDPLLTPDSPPPRA